LDNNYTVFIQYITQLLRDNSAVYIFDSLVKYLIDELCGKEIDTINSINKKNNNKNPRPKILNSKFFRANGKFRSNSRI